MAISWISLPLARVGWRNGRRSLPRTRPPKYLWGISFIFFVLFFYLPLGKILSTGMTGRLFQELCEPRTFKIIWFTVWQAAASALLSLLLGIPSAYIFYVKRFRFQKVLRSLITIPFMLPSIVVAIAFTSLFKGAHGVVVIIIANTFMNYSIATRVIGLAWHHLDPAAFDAAELDGAGRIRTMLDIALPQIRDSIASVGTLIFLYCSANFGIVMVLGSVNTKTIETEIYTSATGFLDFHRSSTLVLVQLLLTFFTLFISGRLVSQSLIQELGDAQFAKIVDKRDFPVILVVSGIVLALICAPIASLALRAFSSGGRWGLSNFANLGTYGARQLLNISVAAAGINSLRNAAITLIISLGLGLLVSFLMARSQVRNQSARLGVDTFFLAPIGISSVVLGFGYLLTFGSGIFPLRSSWLVTPIAQSLLAIPLVIRFIYPALRGLAPELLEVAELDGTSQSQSWWLIQLPLIRQTIALAAGYTVVLSIGEFGAANFLAYGDQGTLPTILFQLISRPGAQNYGMAMAASLVLIVLSGAAIYAFEYVSDSRD